MESQTNRCGSLSGYHQMQAKVYRKKLSYMSKRRGFTLVEVLVVLSILVILFGLLFAPMMAGMDMATTGRAQARLQDTARMAAEQIRRELAEAMYVFPAPTYPTDTSAVTDYSQIVFVPSAANDKGELVTPRQPQRWTNPVSGESEYLVTRYCVKPPDLTGGRLYDQTNPFVLVRQTGLYRYDATLKRYVFGSMVAPDYTVFAVDQPMTENRVTPNENYDIPASNTLCLDPSCRKLQIGYVDKCPACGSTDLLYLHDDVRFRPERIVGEALVPSENNTIYQARHGNWLGDPNNGTVQLGATALSLTDSELQPRLVAYQYNSTTGAYTTIALDTYSGVRNNIALRWNSSTGSVQVGDWHTVHIHVDAGSQPAPGSFWALTVDGDSYDGSGNLSGAPTAAVVPIYPKAPTEWDEPRMPIAYRIEPGRSDGLDAAAKIVPGSTRITVVSGSERGQYTLVQELDQSNLGSFEYSEYLPSDQLWGEVRFSRLHPPSPDVFSAANSFDMYISFYYRRNFDPAPPYNDDVIYADYSTSDVINITLIPQRFIDLEPYKSGLPNMVVPPDLPVGGMAVRTQAVVQNARH